MCSPTCPALRPPPRGALLPPFPGASMSAQPPFVGSIESNGPFHAASSAANEIPPTVVLLRYIVPALSPSTVLYQQRMKHLRHRVHTWGRRVLLRHEPRAQSNAPANLASTQIAELAPAPRRGTPNTFQRPDKVRRVV